jgi:hypothetical protein
MSAPRLLKTKLEVIEALGGYAAVAKIYKVAYQAPHNWANYMPHIPSRLYCSMIDQLRAKNLTAPPALWGMWPHHKRRGSA